MKKLIFILFFACNVVSASTASALYPFTDDSKAKRFQHLTQELRCLVCQNENIADSQAPLAIDLRNIVYQKIKAGENNQQIIDHLVARYGQFVLFKPPMEKKTMALWLGPFVMLFIGALVLLFMIRESNR